MPKTNPLPPALETTQCLTTFVWKVGIVHQDSGHVAHIAGKAVFSSTNNSPLGSVVERITSNDKVISSILIVGIILSRAIKYARNLLFAIHIV